MDLIVDIFNLDSEQDKSPVELTNEEFISKTRGVLNAIDKVYGSCWENRYPTDKECDLLEEKDFIGMTGDVEINGKEINCVTDYETGETLIREFDKERFASEMEYIIFHSENSPFYELLMCKIINKTK